MTGSTGPGEGRVDLTPTMKVHLRALARLADKGYGKAHWGPESSGEWRCAEALERRGLLERNVSMGQRPFSLTKRGLEVGRDV